MNIQTSIDLLEEYQEYGHPVLKETAERYIQITATTHRVLVKEELEDILALLRSEEISEAIQRLYLLKNSLDFPV